MTYRTVRRIPTMAGRCVEVATAPDGRQVVIKRAFDPAAAAALAGYLRQVRRLRELDGIAGYYPPLLACTGDTVVLPCYAGGTLDAAAAGPRADFRRLVAEAVGCVFEISAARTFPAGGALAAARAFWRSQLTRRLDRLVAAGADRATEPLRSIAAALDDGLLDRIVARAVDRPLGLAAHGDLSMHNVLLAGPDEPGPAFRFIDLRGETVWAGGLPWWDPVLDLATLIAFHALIEPALGARDGISRGPEPELATLTRDELVADAAAQPAVRGWVADEQSWRLRIQLGIVVRLLGSVSTQLSTAPGNRRARAAAVTELLAYEWKALMSC